MLIFTIVPLLFVVYFAFTTRDGAFTTENFGKFSAPATCRWCSDSFRLAFFLHADLPADRLSGGLLSLLARFFPAGGPFLVLILLPMWMNFLFAHLRDDDASGAQRRHQHGAGCAGACRARTSSARRRRCFWAWSITFCPS